MKKNLNQINKQKVRLQNQDNWMFPFLSPPIDNHRIHSFYPFNPPYDYICPPYTANPNCFANPYHRYDLFCPSIPQNMAPFAPIQMQHSRNTIKIQSQQIQIDKFKSQSAEKKQQSPQQSEIIENFPIIVKKKAERQIIQKRNEVLGQHNKPYIRKIACIFKCIIQKLISESEDFKKTCQNFKKKIISISRRYQQVIAETEQQLQQKQLFLQQLINKLQEKYKVFKKTKEQMIKYIIRRTYHGLKVHKQLYNKPEYDRLQVFHQKNIATYKSMNTNFLTKQFSNKLFLSLFKQFLQQIDSQLQQQNQEKIIKLSYTLSKCLTENSSNDLILQKKLPWAESYKLKVKKIAKDLLEIYGCINSNEELIKKQE